MKVKELMYALRAFDADAEVRISGTGEKGQELYRVRSAEAVSIHAEDEGKRIIYPDLVKKNKTLIDVIVIY